MTKVKKLPKWAIKQAGGINKKAWALARRGKGRKMAKAKPSKRATRRTPRAVGGGSTHKNSKPGWGRFFKMGRTIDVFTGPVQGSLGNHGLSMEAGEDALDKYSAGVSKGEFDVEILKPTAGGIATGLLRDWLRSKLGIYRGLGQKKILSGVMSANPEILATTEIKPTDDLPRWNDVRVSYDRGYRPRIHDWSLSPNVTTGQRFWRSMGLDAGLKVTQKVAEKYINPMLPPGFNL